MPIWSGNCGPISNWKRKSNATNGMSPEEARYAAQRAFGNATLIREQTREAWGWAPFERLWQDIRYALRQLQRSPGFAITTILILALGIGAVTAVFSLIDTALLKMLPVQDPEQLVELGAVNPAFDVNDAFSYPAFKSFENQTQVLAGALAFRKLADVDVEMDGRSELAQGQIVSGDYFSVLGVRAILGRTILPSDETAPGQNPVAVIGYDYWRTRFALDPGIIGKHVLLNNAPFTIIGVTAPEFYGVEPGEKVGISIPLTMVAAVNPGWAAAGSPADALKAPFRNWLHIMGRLQPGVSREQATSRLAAVFAQSMREAADQSRRIAHRFSCCAPGVSQLPAATGTGQPGTGVAAPAILEASVDRHGGRRLAASYYLRQRRQPVAGALPRQRKGACRQARAWRRERPADSPDAHRERCAWSHRRRHRGRAGVLGQPLIAGTHGAGPQPGLADVCILISPFSPLRWAFLCLPRWFSASCRHSALRM